jgi:hypothetical protein
MPAARRQVQPLVRRADRGCGASGDFPLPHGQTPHARPTDFQDTAHPLTNPGRPTYSDAQYSVDVGSNVSDQLFLSATPSIQSRLPGFIEAPTDQQLRSCNSASPSTMNANVTPERTAIRAKSTNASHPQFLDKRHRSIPSFPPIVQY